MTNSLRKSAWDTKTGEDRRESQPHNLSRGECFGREIGDKKGNGNGGLVPKNRRRNSAKMSHALRYELREPVAKTQPNNILSSD